MYRLRTDSTKASWKSLLKEAVETYNNKAVHSSIKRTPADAYDDPDSIKDVISDHNFKNENANTKPKKYKFKVGDRVRIFKYKNKFEKGYTAKWTNEIFVIDKILNTSPITYQIKDLDNEPILGKFYAEELQKTDF